MKPLDYLMSCSNCFIPQFLYAIILYDKAVIKFSKEAQYKEKHCKKLYVWILDTKRTQVREIKKFLCNYPCMRTSKIKCLVRDTIRTITGLNKCSCIISQLLNETNSLILFFKLRYCSCNNGCSILLSSLSPPNCCSYNSDQGQYFCLDPISTSHQYTNSLCCFFQEVYLSQVKQLSYLTHS
jgi:hypothetical protein